MSNKTKNIIVIVIYVVLVVFTILGFLFINRCMLYGFGFLIPGFIFAIYPLIKSVIAETKRERREREDDAD